MKLALLLATGVALSGIAITPATAQRNKPAEATAPALKLGNPFRQAAAPAQAALQAKNAAEAEPKVAAAEAAATAPDEKYVAAQLRLQLASLNNDKAMQAKAVDAMLASGSPAVTPQLGQLNFYAGNFAYQNNDLPRAIQLLTAAEQAGFTDNGNVYLLLAEAHFKSNQVPTGLGFVERAIAAQPAGQRAPEAWYARAASAAYRAKLSNETAKWTREHVRAYPTVENWRSALVIYRDSQKREGQEMLDIFRLMRQTKSLAGERDYFEYAALASERGLPGEAKAVIDEGLATKTVPAGSRALTERRTAANAKIAADRASLAAAERQAATAANGRLAANTADAFIGYGEDAKAVALYRTALSKGGVDVDAVNTRLGVALARSGDLAGARTAFQAVKGPRAGLAGFWLLWLDQKGAAPAA